MATAVILDSKMVFLYQNMAFLEQYVLIYLLNIGRLNNCSQATFKGREFFGKTTGGFKYTVPLVGCIDSSAFCP